MKILKKVLLSSFSILGISFLGWVMFLLNPSLSYANQTQFDYVTIYHNATLQDGTEMILKDAFSMIKKADIFDESIEFQLCLNDDKVYPYLNPFAGATAYAFLDKTIMYASQPDFNKNVAEFQWEVNNYELRKYNLTRLLAHEFMHNLQYNENPSYYISSTLGTRNWKFEGHAEYISRGFKNDNQLKEKLDLYLHESDQEHKGIPVFKLEDGTIQSLSYFKYAIVVQYLMEVKGLNFGELCDLETSFDDNFAEVIAWSE